MDWTPDVFGNLPAARAAYGRGGWKRRNLRQSAIALTGLLLIAGVAAPARAAPEPSAKLVRCGAGSCLRISGHRRNAAAIVRVNGHAVSAEGERHWKVDLRVETVRDWSAPHARTIEVSLHDPETPHGSRTRVDLPIGLLGGLTSLASLVVRVD